MAPSTNTITINVTQQGAQTVTRAIEDIGRGANTAASSVQLLQGALATIGVGTSLNEIVQQLGTFQGLQNQIKSVTDGLAVQVEVMDRLTAAAIQARQPLDAHIQLYQRMSFAAKDLRLSQQQMIDVTVAIGAALTIQNASAEQTRIIVNELSRAMVEGTVTSRDWMALIRNAPQVIQLMATALHNMANTDLGFKRMSEDMNKSDVAMLKASESAATLKLLLDQGKVSSEIFTKGILMSKEAIIALLDTLQKTIPQAFVVLQTRLEVYIGKLGTATGASNALANAILYVSLHLDEIRKTAEAAGIAILIAFGPSALKAVASLSAGLALLALRNPWIALLAGIGAVVGAIVAFDRDSQTANTSVGLLREGLNLLTEGAKAAGTALANAFGKSSFEEFVRTGLANMRATLVAGLPLVAGLIVGTFTAIGGAVGAVWDTMVTGAENAAKHIANLFINTFNYIAGGINSLIDALNRLPDPRGKGPLPRVPSIDPLEMSPYGASAGEKTGDAFKRGFSGAYDIVNQFFERIGKGWDAVAARAEKAGRDSAIGYSSEVLGNLKLGGALPLGPVEGSKTDASLNVNQQSNAYLIGSALKELNATDQAIAAFLANFKGESGYDPTKINKESGATNFAQWLGPRLDELKKIGDPLALSTGLEQMKRELLGPYASVLKAANEAGSQAEAVRVVAERYEVFGKRGEPKFEAELARRQAFAASGATGGLAGGPTTDPLAAVPPGDTTLTRPQQNAFVKTIAEASIVEKTREELELYTTTLDKAMKMGLLDAQAKERGITAEEERARLLGVITGKLQDQAQPLQALLRPLNEQVMYLNLLDPAEKAAAQGADKMTESMRKLGEPLNAASQKWLKEYLTGVEKTKAVQSEMETVWKSSATGALVTFNTKMEALNNLMAAGALRVDEYNDAWAKAKADVLEHSDSMFDGIQAGLLRVSSGFGTEAKIWSDAVQAVFSTTEQWISTLVTEGKGKFSDLIKSIEADLAKAAFKGAMKELLGLGGGGEGSTSGGLLGAIFGTSVGGKGGGSSSGTAGGSGFGGLSSIFGPAGNAVGGGGGILGNLFSGGNKDAKESPLGDYWLSYAQGLKDKGSDVTMGLKEAGIDAAGMGALKSDALFWSGAGQGGFLSGIGDTIRGWFAEGGQMYVPGQGGTDTVPVSFMATPGERVTIETPAQQAASRLNGFRGGFANGGEFDVAGGPTSNFTPPTYVPDYFANEPGPFLTPGANQSSDDRSTFVPLQSHSDYLKGLQSGTLFRPPTVELPPAPPPPTPTPEAATRAVERAAGAVETAADVMAKFQAGLPADLTRPGRDAINPMLRLEDLDLSKLTGGRPALGGEFQYDPSKSLGENMRLNPSSFNESFGIAMGFAGGAGKLGAGLLGRLFGDAGLSAGGRAVGRAGVSVEPRLFAEVPKAPAAEELGAFKVVDGVPTIGGVPVLPGAKLFDPMGLRPGGGLSGAELDAAQSWRAMMGRGTEDVIPAARSASDRLFDELAIPPRPAGIQVGGTRVASDAELAASPGLRPRIDLDAPLTDAEIARFYGRPEPTASGAARASAAATRTASGRAARATGLTEAEAAAVGSGYTLGGALKGAAMFPLRHKFLTATGAIGGWALMGGLADRKPGDFGLPTPGELGLAPTIVPGSQMPQVTGSPGANGIVPSAAAAAAASPGHAGAAAVAASSQAAVAAAATEGAAVPLAGALPQGESVETRKYWLDYGKGLAKQVAEGHMSPAEAAKNLVKSSGGAISQTEAEKLIKGSGADKAGDKKKGIGTWGWIGIGAAALALGGALAWWLMHRKKQNTMDPNSSDYTGPAYGAGWPNKIGAWPTGYAEGGDFTVGDAFDGGSATDFSNYGDQMSAGGGYGEAFSSVASGVGNFATGFGQGAVFEEADRTKIIDDLKARIDAGTMTKGQALARATGMLAGRLPFGMAAEGTTNVARGIYTLAEQIHDTTFGGPNALGYVPETEVPGQGGYGPMYRAGTEGAVNLAFAGMGVGGLLRGGGAGSVGGMFIGSKGAGNLVGEGESTGMLRASTLLRGGADREAVRQATGWFRGVDGLLRREISDAGATLRPGWERATTLGGALDHPELFKAYPEAANIGFGVTDSTGGAFYYDGRAGGTRGIAVGAGLVGDRYALSAVAHEAQHFVQDVEGFGRGASPEEFVARATYDTMSPSGALNRAAAARIADRLYEATSGEQEAFLTQARLGLTAGQRAASSPFGTGRLAYEVPEAEQVFRGTQGLGFAEMAKGKEPPAAWDAAKTLALYDAGRGPGHLVYENWKESKGYTRPGGEPYSKPIADMKADEQAQMLMVLDTMKRNPVAQYLKHAENAQYLQFMIERGNVAEKAMASRELEVAQAKMAWWQNVKGQDRDTGVVSSYWDQHAADLGMQDIRAKWRGPEYRGPTPPPGPRTPYQQMLDQIKADAQRGAVTPEQLAQFGPDMTTIGRTPGRRGPTLDADRLAKAYGRAGPPVPTRDEIIKSSERVQGSKLASSAADIAARGEAFDAMMRARAGLPPKGEPAMSFKEAVPEPTPVVPPAATESLFPGGKVPILDLDAELTPAEKLRAGIGTLKGLFGDESGATSINTALFGVPGMMDRVSGDAFRRMLGMEPRARGAIDVETPLGAIEGMSAGARRQADATGRSWATARQLLGGGMSPDELARAYATSLGSGTGGGMSRAGALEYLRDQAARDWPALKPGGNGIPPGVGPIPGEYTGPPNAVGGAVTDWNEYNRLWGIAQRLSGKPGFAGGGDFAVSDFLPFGGAKDAGETWMSNQNYTEPKGSSLPSAALFAQRGALTEPGPVGLAPRSFWDSLGGLAGGFGSFITKGIFGSDAPMGSLVGGDLFARGGQFVVPGFAEGGSFDVGGFGGTDNTLVAFKASPGEHVQVTPPVNVTRGGSAGTGGHTTIHNWSIETPDANSFMRSSGQIAVKVGTVVERATRRNA